jgi:hypothetical protein
MEWYRSHLRRPRFNLAEIAGLVVAVAVALRWPFLLVPTIAVVYYVLCERLGLSVIWCLLSQSVLGLVTGLIMGHFATR